MNQEKELLPEQSEVQDEVFVCRGSKPDPRTYLTGRRRKDDPTPLKTKDDERTSFIVNKYQYQKVRAIALQESMTIKELVYQMFQLGIDRYEKKHGPVVDKEQKKDLF